jgi:hypothetical protein
VGHSTVYDEIHFFLRESVFVRIEVSCFKKYLHGLIFVLRYKGNTLFRLIKVDTKHS